MYITFQHHINFTAMSKFHCNCYDFIESLQHVINTSQVTTKTPVESENNHIFVGVDEFSPEEVEKVRPISVTLTKEAMVYYEKRDSRSL